MLYNKYNKKDWRRSLTMKRIKTIAVAQKKTITACGECRSTCQSACKTSCTVGNQSCEKQTREKEIKEVC